MKKAATCGMSRLEKFFVFLSCNPGVTLQPIFNVEFAFCDQAVSDVDRVSTQVISPSLPVLFPPIGLANSCACAT
jgi:hypothetical protein